MKEPLRNFTTYLIPLLAVLLFAVAPVTYGRSADPPANGNQTDTVGDVPEGAATPDSPEASNDAEPKPARTLDLSNPRATMRTFLVAIQEAAADQPERIDEAVACLDTSQIEGDEAKDRARALARRLHALIDRIGVTIDDLPEETPNDQPYEFYKPEPKEGEEATSAIVIQLDDESGRWLFSAQTLAAIPALEARLAEKQEEPKSAETGVPPSRRSPRATMTTFLAAMNADPPNVDEAVQCLDPIGRDPKAWEVRGRDLAFMLKNVMDKVAVVVTTEIPDASEGPPHVWFTSATGNITIARVDADDETLKTRGLVRGEWRFTPKTLSTLPALYAEYEKKEIRQELQDKGVQEDLPWGLWIQKQIPDSMRREILSLEAWQWPGLALILFAGWLVKHVGAFLVSLIFWRLFHSKKLDIEADIRRRALRSSGAVLTMIFWFYAVVDANVIVLPETWLGVLTPVIKFGLALTSVIVGYRFVDIVGGYIVANKEIRLTQFDEVLVPMLRTILRIVVVVIVILFVADYWFEQPPSAVIGALGIGGVALAFAAKDTISNFFGSITVLLDRPFGIGDWIVVGDVEGTVEKLGFRSTRVRTFYNSLITVPNSRMVDTNVDNYGHRRYRRAKIMLSLTYDTPPEKIDAFCEGIRELIRLHPYTRKDYYHVYFNQFGAASLDVLLYAFFEVPDWSTELRERHKLFNDILRLAKRIGVEFAYPTQTLLLERVKEQAKRVSEAESKLTIDDPDAHGVEKAAHIFTEVYGTDPERPSPVYIDRSPKSRRD